MFQYITHVHFYKIKWKYIDAKLDAPDNAISGNEPSSEMLTCIWMYVCVNVCLYMINNVLYLLIVSVLWILTFEQRMVI